MNKLFNELLDKLALDFATPKHGQMNIISNTLNEFLGSDFLWLFDEGKNDNHVFPLRVGFDEDQIKRKIGGAYCYLLKSDKYLVPITPLVAMDQAIELPFNPDKIHSLDELRDKIKSVLEYGNTHGCWAPKNSLDRDYTSSKSWLEYFLLKRNTTMTDLMRRVIIRSRTLDQLANVN